MNGILTEKPLNALRAMLFIDFWNFTLQMHTLENGFPIDLVRDLLEGFVDPEIVSKLDLSPAGLDRSNSSYVAEDLRDRIDDIVWRVGFQGSDLSLCSKVLLPRKTGSADFPEAHSLLEVERMLVEGQHQWVDNLLKQGEERKKRETALRMLEWGDSDEKILACARISPKNSPNSSDASEAKQSEPLAALPPPRERSPLLLTFPTPPSPPSIENSAHSPATPPKHQHPPPPPPKNPQKIPEIPRTENPRTPLTIRHSSNKFTRNMQLPLHRLRERCRNFHGE